jgi:hypothetical protein
LAFPIFREEVNRSVNPRTALQTKMSFPSEDIGLDNGAKRPYLMLIYNQALIKIILDLLEYFKRF